MLIYIQTIILLVSTLIAAYTDFKTGYIYDYITLPLVILGIILALIYGYFFNALIVGGVTFLVGYFFYYFGKLGGGDVKLFTGISVIIPYSFGVPTVLIVLFLASVSSLVFYSIKYLYLIIKFSAPNYKRNILVSLALGIIIFVILVPHILFAILFSVFATLMFITMLSRKYIEEKYFIKEIKLEELEDDDVANLRFMGKGNMVPLDKKLKESIQKERMVDKVEVYRNLPIFGPFIFIGVVILTLLLFYLDLHSIFVLFL